jgi:hypothetical protein
MAVCERLAAASRPVVIDYAAYLTRYAASIRHEPSGNVRLALDDPNIDALDWVRAVWWRRPLAFAHRAAEDREHRRYLDIQCEFFWTGFLALLPPNTVWYNDWRADHAADRNLLQLRIAAELGLAIPDTLVTSSVEEVAAFAPLHGQIAFKSFGGSRRYWRPTALYSPNAIAELWKHGSYPLIFQEYIDGEYDYRVVCIDEHTTSVEFHTARSRYPYDVRVDALLPGREVILEQPVTRRLRQMCERLGLRFAAFDLRRRRSGELVFLELNPGGQFLYLDQRARTDIVGAMAHALCVDANE